MKAHTSPYIIQITYDPDSKSKQVSMACSQQIDFDTALRLLVASISAAANHVVSTAKSSEISADQVIALKGDIADRINYAISNILNELSPKDPSLQLSEVAIATMENKIIHEARDKGITLKEALDSLEKELADSPYSPAHLKKCPSTEDKSV